jgi:hypothetical protein
MTAGIDGDPTPAQKYLIQRLAIDILRSELLDFRAATGTLTDLDARVAHALRGTIRLGLRKLQGLGKKARSRPEPTPTQLVEMFPPARKRA